MRRVFLILAALLLFAGCKTVEKTKTVYVSRFQVDSVYIDCTDSVFFTKIGDTVTIREILTRTEYRYRLLTDTLRQSDTVIVTKKELVNTTCGKARKNFFIFGLIIGLLIIFALYLLTKKLLR